MESHAGHGAPATCHRTAMIEVRALTPDELPMAAEIDVTEDGTVVLEQQGTVLRSRQEEWHRPPRDAAGWRELEARWRAFVPASGLALGAFEGARLVGIATLRRAIRPGLDQLEALFVDRAHRRRGVATALVAGIEAHSRSGGARRLYVSATPSTSAVGFYASRGFAPTSEPIAELLAVEPDDVHMTLGL